MNTVQDKSEPRSQRNATAIRHQDLNDRLLAAAEQVIAADGLPSLRARALAETVGCSVGAIYGVFPDLDALVLVVNGRTLEAIDAAMRDTGSGSGPAEHLVRLAEAYLGYAAAHRQRWSALFHHRMPEGRTVTPWYAARQAAAFAHIEAPLAVLQPGLPDTERALLARTLFSAVHGMVELGLDEKVVAVPLPVLRAQVRLVVQAIAGGLSAGPL
jgi:AcrR family transcriptional regulator